MSKQEKKNALEETNLEETNLEEAKLEETNETITKLDLMRDFEEHIGNAFMIMQKLKVSSPFNNLKLAENTLLKVADLWPNKLLAITLRQTLKAKGAEQLKPEIAERLQARKVSRSKAPAYAIKGKNNLVTNEQNAHLKNGGKEKEIGRFSAPTYITGAKEIKKHHAVEGNNEKIEEATTAEKKESAAVATPLPFNYLEGEQAITLEEIASAEPEALANYGMANLKTIMAAMNMQQGKSKSKVAMATRLINRAIQELSK